MPLNALKLSYENNKTFCMMIVINIYWKKKLVASSEKNRNSP